MLRLSTTLVAARASVVRRPAQQVRCLAEGATKKRRKKKVEAEIPEAKKKKVVYENLPKPYFFLEINSDGSSRPASPYNMHRYPNANYQVEKTDLYTAKIYQKHHGEQLVSTAAEQAVEDFRSKYKF